MDDGRRLMDDGALSFESDSDGDVTPCMCPPPPASDTRDEARPETDRLHAETANGDAVNGADPLTLRAATLLPADLLNGGEVILLLLKPSPLYIVLGALRPLLTIAVITAICVSLNQFSLRISGDWALRLPLSSRDILLAGFGIFGIRLFWQLLEWLSRIYVLTDQRVIRVRGVLTVSVFQAPLSQLQQTDMIFTVRERLFGLGTLAFSTAGTAAREAYWVMIAKPLEVHQAVLEAIKRYR